MCRGLTCLLLSIINTAVMIAGFILTIVGGLLKWNKAFLEKLYGDAGGKVANQISNDAKDTLDRTVETLQQLSSPLGLTMFIVGLILMFVGLIAIFGVCCQMKILLITYASLVAVVVLIHFILIIVYFANKDLLLNPARKTLKESVQKYKSIESNSAESIFLAVFMPAFQCCGYDGPADFKKTGAGFTGRDRIKNVDFPQIQYPAACCKAGMIDTDLNSCPKKFTPENSNIGRGCKTAVDTWLVEMGNKISLGSLVVLGINVAVLIMAIINIISTDFD